VDFGACPASFVTLTYHFGASEISSNWHADLNHWLISLVRDWPSHYRGHVWKLEAQRRGVPHFHLIVFWRREVDIMQLRRWTARVWNAIAEPGDEQALSAGTRADPLQLHHKGGAGRLMRYLVKYIGKCEQNRFSDPVSGERLKTGRMWGIGGDVPQTIVAILALDYRGRVEFCKRLRKWGKRSRYLRQIGKRYPGAQVFGSPGTLMQLLRGIPAVGLYVAQQATEQGPAP
jgi:hypothetical protein